ncbi:MAG: YgiT-type zinc finger protein [Treponema sp.]|nr:YgiT-type zinc finger protein [Treponema sp.]
MKCGICKADMEEKNVTYTEDVDQAVIVIRQVPAHVCTECGNIWYSGTVVIELEKLVDMFVSQTGQEVAVINFSRKSA